MFRFILALVGLIAVLQGPDAVGAYFTPDQDMAGVADQIDEEEASASAATSFGWVDGGGAVGIGF